MQCLFAMHSLRLLVVFRLRFFRVGRCRSVFSSLFVVWGSCRLVMSLPIGGYSVSKMLNASKGIHPIFLRISVFQAIGFVIAICDAF